MLTRAVGQGTRDSMKQGYPFVFIATLSVVFLLAMGTSAQAKSRGSSKKNLCAELMNPQPMTSPQVTQEWRAKYTDQDGVLGSDVLGVLHHQYLARYEQPAMTMLDTAVNQLDVVNTDLLDVQFVDHGKNSVLRLLVEISIDVFNMQEPYFIIPYLKRFWTPSVTHSHYQHWIELRNEPYLGVAVEGTGNLSENQHKYSVQRVASA